MVPPLAFWIRPNGAKLLAVSTFDEQSKDAALEFIVLGTSMKAGVLNE